MVICFIIKQAPRSFETVGVLKKWGQNPLKRGFPGSLLLNI